MGTVISSFFDMIGQLFSIRVPGLGMTLSAFLCILVVLCSVTWIIRCIAGGGEK